MKKLQWDAGKGKFVEIDASKSNPVVLPINNTSTHEDVLDSISCDIGSERSGDDSEYEYKRDELDREIDMSRRIGQKSKSRKLVDSEEEEEHIITPKKSTFEPCARSLKSRKIALVLLKEKDLIQAMEIVFEQLKQLKAMTRDLSKDL